MAGYSAETCGQALDIGGTGISVGATLGAGAYGLGIGIHANTAGTYRIYGMDGTNYEDLYLAAGFIHPYLSTKIKTTAGENITDGALCVALK